MVQSAFRNLVNTQYEVPKYDDTGMVQQGTMLVSKAYLTYEEVVNQIARDFCQEELDILFAYLNGLELPTREEQLQKIEEEEKKQLEAAKKLRAKEKPITIKDIMKANKINPQLKKPIYWNDPSLIKGVTKKRQNKKKK